MTRDIVSRLGCANVQSDVAGVWISDNIVLEMLRAIRADIAELKTGNIDLKEQVGVVEGQTASISRRLDHVAGDVEHIKRRLDLVSAF